MVGAFNVASLFAAWLNAVTVGEDRIHRLYRSRGTGGASSPQLEGALWEGAAVMRGLPALAARAEGGRQRGGMLPRSDALLMVLICL